MGYTSVPVLGGGGLNISCPSIERWCSSIGGLNISCLRVDADYASVPSRIKEIERTETYISLSCC